MSKILSILVCALTRRATIIQTLMSYLLPQITPHVELLIAADNGEKSTGEKRNELLSIASGKYIVFIDDDDVVAPGYVALILNAVKNDCDVVGLHLIMTNKGRPGSECRTYHSLKYRTWYDEPDPNSPGRRRYFRSPNHLNPVKRELALAVKFPTINTGEDHDYSKRLLPLLKTETYIEKPIYFYLAGRC